MPITKTQFYTAVEQRVRDLMQEIHALLSQNKELAYSEDELLGALHLPQDAETQAAFREAVRALAGLEAVRWGLVRDQEYYIYNQDLEAS
jgi:hypothetical protein